MAALSQNIDPALVPDYLKSFLEWSQKKRQEKLARYEQKKIEEQKIAQSRAARTSILATPLRQVSAPQKANQQPWATPSTKPLESRISAVPSVTPAREDMTRRWQPTDGSKTPSSKKAVKILTPVKGMSMTPSRVKVASTAVDLRLADNDVDDLEMRELAALIDKRRLEARDMAQDGDFDGARKRLAALEDEDIRAPSHARWWVARAHLEEFAGDFDAVIKLLEEGVEASTKERHIIKPALHAFMQRRIEEHAGQDEINDLLPSPSGKSPRTPDEVSETGGLTAAISSLSIAPVSTAAPVFDIESGETAAVETAPVVITVTEERVTPSTPTRGLASPRRLPAEFMLASTKAIEAAKQAEEKENAEQVTVKTETGAQIQVTPQKKSAPTGKALAVFAAAALAEHDLFAEDQSASSTSAKKQPAYVDDYADFFAEAKKTLRRFGLYTSYQAVVPSASKRRNAAKSNATPVAMKVNRRLVHRTGHHSPSKVAVVTPVRRSMRLERAAANALKNVGVHVEKPKKEKIVAKVEDAQEAEEDPKEEGEEEEVEDEDVEEGEEETEDVLVYLNPHIKIENDF